MPPKKKAYEMSKELLSGTQLLDVNKKTWVIKNKLGKGGFGLIYTASLLDNGKAGKDDYIIKVEPVDNGPIFCEINFYTRCAKEATLNEFKSQKNLKHLGIPRFVGFGFNTLNRFLIMDRFDQDLHRIMRSQALSLITTLKIGLQVLHALEFLHSQEFVHADIKGLNILRGRGADSNIYLVDYGLVFRFASDGVHKLEKVDPKYKHNGTIEFCSTDAHSGYPPSRRGDVEILGYNLLDWLSQSLYFINFGSLPEVTFGLPWFSVIKPYAKKRDEGMLPENVKEAVGQAKKKAFQEPRKLVEDVLCQAACEPRDFPKYNGLVRYFEHCKGLKYDDKPDYNYLQTCLCNTIQTLLASTGSATPRKDSVKVYGDVCLDWTPIEVESRRKLSQLPKKRSSSKRNGVEDVAHDDLSDLSKPTPPKQSLVECSGTKETRSSVLRTKVSITKKKTSPKMSTSGSVTKRMPMQATKKSRVAKASDTNAPANEIIPGLMAWKGVAKKPSTVTPNRKSAVCQTSPELLKMAQKRNIILSSRKPK